MKFSRILVLIFSIFVPIFILYTFIFQMEFKLTWLPSDWGYNSIIIYTAANWVAPILFCVGWLYFNILLAKRFASTIELIQETSSMISAHYIIFYGICALAMLVSFLIPLLTPIVTVLSFSSLIFNLLTSRVDWDTLDDKTKKFVKTVTILINIPVIFCTILVVPEIVIGSIDLFINFMEIMIEPLYRAIRALGVALPIGNFILLYQNATQGGSGKKFDAPSKKNLSIGFFEIIIAAVFIFLEYNLDPTSTGYEFFQYLYYIGIFFWILSFIANFSQGRNKKGTFNKEGGIPPQSPLSLIMFGVFWVATMIFGNESLVHDDWIRYLVVGFGAFVFLAVFFLVFIGHPDLEDS